MYNTAPPRVSRLEVVLLLMILITIFPDGCASTQDQEHEQENQLAYWSAPRKWSDTYG